MIFIQYSSSNKLVRSTSLFPVRTATLQSIWRYNLQICILWEFSYQVWHDYPVNKEPYQQGLMVSPPPLIVLGWSRCLQPELSLLLTVYTEKPFAEIHSRYVLWVSVMDFRIFWSSCGIAVVVDAAGTRPLFPWTRRSSAWFGVFEEDMQKCVCR